MSRKSDLIRTLLGQGLSVSEIAKKSGASAPYVYSIKNAGRKKAAAKRAVTALPKRRGRRPDPKKRLARIERYALLLARELAKAA